MTVGAGTIAAPAKTAGSGLGLFERYLSVWVALWRISQLSGITVSDSYFANVGLAASRIGLVLVTPALLARLPKESVADEELSALLAGNRLVPIVHNTTYEALRNVSPLLASRSGLDSAEDSMAVIATKISELVAL